MNRELRLPAWVVWGLLLSGLSVLIRSEVLHHRLKAAYKAVAECEVA